ncbi:MAG: DUF6265 family protein [Rhodothermales bacterium]
MRVLLIVLFAMASLPSAAQEASCGNLDSVAWMAGTWETESNSRRTVEHWAFVSEKTMEGWGRVYRTDSRNIEGEETLRLLEMSGEVFFVAKVGGNAFPVPFK